MFKYVLKRIALMFFVLFVILTMCFILVKLLPVTDAKQFGKDMNLILQRREASCSFSHAPTIPVSVLQFCTRMKVGIL